jgi:hypothetical protein
MKQSSHNPRILAFPLRGHEKRSLRETRTELSGVKQSHNLASRGTILKGLVLLISFFPIIEKFL